MWRRSCLSCGAAAAASAPSAASGVAARRGFYSGLDESRVHRLRRSGMTFNHPRGRDTFSIAFESRLRLVPLTQMSDLYGPIDASLLTAVKPDDPTSSEGNPLEKKKVMAGDERMRHVVEGKKRAEASLREKRDWHVLVVDPVEQDMVRAPVAFPSAHPAYYSDWAAPASRAVLQRRAVPAFGLPAPSEQREEADHSSSSPTGSGNASTRSAIGSGEEEGGVLPPPSQADARESTAASSSSTPQADHPTDFAYFYGHEDQRHLQQSGDTSLLPGCRVCEATLRLAADSAASATSAATTLHAIRQHFHTAVCIDPDIRHERFRREEAQVEMISAYRNILYEAVEVGRAGSMRGGGGPRETCSSTGPHPQPQHQPPRPRATPFVADVVRVPVLCQYSSVPRFAHELGKLNQQAVIKGFHRLSNEAKEALIVNRSFTVELYVPPVLLEQFERAFLEEAWEVPLSTLNPGRTALYPGLAPPATLLQYDGWIGKRQELIDGIATKGRSLLRGDKYGLDGRLIEQREVLANMRVFGAAAERQRMLEGERQTAVAQLGVSASATYAPLQAGLMADAEDSQGAPSAASPAEGEKEPVATPTAAAPLSGSPTP